MLNSSKELQIQKWKGQLLPKLLHHKVDVIQKSMQYFRALLEEGDKDTLTLYFERGSQTAPK